MIGAELIKRNYKPTVPKMILLHKDKVKQSWSYKEIAGKKKTALSVLALNNIKDKTVD